MSGSDGLRAAARKDADLMVSDLNRVSGLLEEVATIWRRAELYGRESSSTAPSHLQEAARGLAALLRAVPDADCGQHPALAFSAVAQLAALESNAALSEALTLTGGSHLGDAQIWAAIQGALLRVSKQLWSLIACLVKIGDTPVTEDVMAELPMMGDRLAQPQPAAAETGDAQRALEMQGNAIGALPEAELRRLLQLIGGMDPAALQRAAAAYTEMFCAVAGMEASVAALRPVAMAAACDDPQDPGQ